MGLYLLLSQSLIGKYNQKHFGHAKQSATDALKTSSKRFIQKTAEGTSDLVGNKIANKITKFQKIHDKIFQKQLKMSMIKKTLNKDIYLQMKCKKLLMNWD